MDFDKRNFDEFDFQHIEQGTTIISDCWKGYDTRQLTNAGYTHLTINHSRFFRDPDTGAHTNSIEGTWMHVKRSLNKNGTMKELLPNYFTEFMWRRRFLDGNVDPFALFLRHIALYHHEVPHIEDEE
jgi:hypothetical protein